MDKISRYFCCCMHDNLSSQCSYMNLPRRPIKSELHSSTSLSIKNEKEVSNNRNIEIQKQVEIKKRNLATLIQKRMRGFLAIRKVKILRKEVELAGIGDNEIISNFTQIYMEDLLANILHAFERQLEAACIIQRFFAQVIYSKNNSIALNSQHKQRQQQTPSHYLFRDKIKMDTYRRIWGREYFEPNEIGWPVIEQNWKNIQKSGLTNEIPPENFANGSTRTIKSTLYRAIKTPDKRHPHRHFEDNWVAVPIELMDNVDELPIELAQSKVYQNLAFSPYKTKRQRTTSTTTINLNLIDQPRPYTPSWVDTMQSSISTVNPTSMMLEPVNTDLLYRQTTFDSNNKSPSSDSILNRSVSRRGISKPNTSQPLSNSSSTLKGMSTSNLSTQPSATSPKSFKSTKNIHSVAYMKAQSNLQSASLPYRLEGSDSYYQTLHSSSNLNKFTTTQKPKSMKNKLYKLKYTWMPERLLGSAMSHKNKVLPSNEIDPGTPSYALDILNFRGYLDPNQTTIRGILNSKANSTILQDTTMSQLFDISEPFYKVREPDITLESKTAELKKILGKSSKFSHPSGYISVPKIKDPQPNNAALLSSGCISTDDTLFPHPFPWAV